MAEQLYIAGRGVGLAEKCWSGAGGTQNTMDVFWELHPALEGRAVVYILAKAFDLIRVAGTQYR
jgi:hypothetical protein